MFESYFPAPAVPRPLRTTPHCGDDSERLELDTLGDRIAELAAQIQAATYQLLVMIHEFDERGGWGGGGFVSCAQWLNWRSGIGMGAAREKVRVAHALAVLPLISDAMRQGRVSYSKVRAMTRVATPETEARLLEFALMGSASQVERLVRCWRRVDRIEEAARDVRRRQAHVLSTWTDEDGMLVIYGRLEPEVGAVVMRALEAAQERLYQESRVEAAEWRAGKSLNRRSEEPLERRRADAMGLVAEAALASELDPGTRGDRYLVTLHLEAANPGETGDDGIAFLEDGVGVSAETSRRLACDSTTVTMTHDSARNVLNVGRKTRTISPGLRRALGFRDRTCRFPGCGVTVCDGHHVHHWADGGETKLDNLVLLCRRHHMAVHEQGWTVRIEPIGSVRFFDPKGLELPVVPTPARLAWDSAKMLEPLLTADGVTVDRWTGAATTDSRRCDYGLAIDWVRPTHPVLDEGGLTDADVPAGTSETAEPIEPSVSEGVELANWFAELFRDCDD